MMNAKFKMGDRVRVSKVGVDRNIRQTRMNGNKKKPTQTGTIVGGSYYPEAVGVMFDGLKTRQCLHVDFLEVVS